MRDLQAGPHQVVNLDGVDTGTFDRRANAVMVGAAVALNAPRNAWR